MIGMTGSSSCCYSGSQLSRVQLFVTPWTAAHQASLSFTVSWSLLKLMSIALVMPPNHLILCRPLLLHLSQHQGLFQWVDVCLAQETIRWFFKLASVYIPISSMHSHVFQLSIPLILAMTWYDQSFKCRLSNGCVVVSWYGFYLHFPNDG